MTATKLPSQMMQQIADRIRALRLRRNWTREQLADYAKVNVYSLKRFERTGHISLERLLALCFTLEVIDDFDHILKPRERINVAEWAVSNRKIRKRGSSHRALLESANLE